MKVIRYVAINPLGIALTLVHWIVVAFAFLGDIRPSSLGFGMHSSTYLMEILVMLNLLALFMASFSAQLLNSIFSIGVWSTPLYIVLVISLITLQWMLAGAAVRSVFDQHRLTDTTNNDLGLGLD